jgi:carboxy-cis,cis-muconate cyclase
MYVILEAWNAMALYFINETTHMPYYTNALYPLVPPGMSLPYPSHITSVTLFPDVVAGNYGAQSAVLSAKGSMIWVTSHSRVVGVPGYLSGFSLREDGLPSDFLFQIKTRNSGGRSLNMAASPFNENLVAVTESEWGSVGVYRYNGTSAQMVASVDIVDSPGRANGGCCSDAVWLD